MEQAPIRENVNDVNGSQAVQAAVASGRDDHDRQVIPVHQQATAGGQNGCGERAATGRYIASVKMKRDFRVGAWNVPS